MTDINIYIYAHMYMYHICIHRERFYDILHNIHIYIYVYVCPYISHGQKNWFRILKIYIYIHILPLIHTSPSHSNGNHHLQTPRYVACAPWPGSLLWRTARPVEANDKAVMPSAPRGSGRKNGNGRMGVEKETKLSRLAKCKILFCFIG